MGNSASVLGPRLGALHAWRTRGSIYLDGIRTSSQVGLLGAGVAKGAGFTDAEWATYFGIAIVVAFEVGKVFAGWIDYRYNVIHRDQQMVAEANPMLMRQVNALERLVALGEPPRPSRFRHEPNPLTTFTHLTETGSNSR